MRILATLWQSSAFLFSPVQQFFNAQFWQVFLEKFGDFKGKSVLDLACGTGELRRHISPKKYLGVDINPFYIAHAQKSFSAPQTKFLIADITVWEPADEFDSALLISTAHHLSDAQLHALSKIVAKSNIREFIVVDGAPTGPGAKILAWLDVVLAGGRFFRNQEELAKILARYFKIKKMGQFLAKHSFYIYPFVVAAND